MDTFYRNYCTDQVRPSETHLISCKGFPYRLSHPIRNIQNWTSPKGQFPFFCIVRLFSKSFWCFVRNWKFKSLRVRSPFYLLRHYETVSILSISSVFGFSQDKFNFFNTWRYNRTTLGFTKKAVSEHERHTFVFFHRKVLSSSLKQRFLCLKCGADSETFPPC